MAPIDLTVIENLLAHTTCLYDHKQIEAAIDRVAKEMNEKLANKTPLFLCVMNGAVVFMGQLITRLNFPLQIDYVHATRYQGTMHGAKLDWMAEPSTPLKDRVVVIVEDILDGGLTLAAVSHYCKQQKAKEIYCAALLDKNRPREEGGIEKCDFTGLYVENKFLIGYGLDYEGFCRNLPGIYAVNL